MDSLNDAVRDYTYQLMNGSLQHAYGGIMTSLTTFGRYFSKRNPTCKVGALYQGYMDMTYIPLIPPGYRERGLKIAVVYIHGKGRFEVWLSAVNKKVGRTYAEVLAQKDLFIYTLNPPGLGIDSIVEMVLEDSPDFDHLESLMEKLESGTVSFILSLNSFLEIETE